MWYMILYLVCFLHYNGTARSPNSLCSSRCLVYLKTKGVDPKTHPVIKELVRSGYFFYA